MFYDGKGFLNAVQSFGVCIIDNGQTVVGSARYGDFREVNGVYDIAVFKIIPQKSACILSIQLSSASSVLAPRWGIAIIPL